MRRRIGARGLPCRAALSQGSDDLSLAGDQVVAHLAAESPGVDAGGGGPSER